jgi:Amt family ammonium transporter
MDELWVVVLAAAALLVRVGQAAGGMGMARAKNAASAGIRNLADFCVATLSFWAIGAAILFQQHNGVLGFHLGHFVGWEGLSPNWLKGLVMALIASAVIVPAVSERSKLIVSLAAGAVLAALLVPLTRHWTERGWLSTLGFIDVAGAASIHLTAALCAAVAAIFVGPRDGKYNRDGSSNMIPGHNVSLILISVLLTFIGWVPYVCLLAPAQRSGVAAANVFIAAAAGGAASLLVGRIRFGKADVLLTCVGILGGLVGITAAADSVRTLGAFLIGVVAGVAIPWVTVMIDLRLKLDDPGGVVAIHGVGGVWALVAASIFTAAPITVGQRLQSAGIQLLGIVVIAITVIAVSGALMLLLRSTTGLRSRDADEYDGLDLAEHDINAHPDFQQTMIKSYHLREA